MDLPDPQDQTEQPEQSEKANGKVAKAEPTKPITVVLGEDLLKRLKVIAVMKDTSISAVVETYVSKGVKADIRKAIGKLDV